MRERREGNKTASGGFGNCSNTVSNNLLDQKWGLQRQVPTDHSRLNCRHWVRFPSHKEGMVHTEAEHLSLEMVPILARVGFKH